MKVKQAKLVLFMLGAMAASSVENAMADGFTPVQKPYLLSTAEGQYLYSNGEQLMLTNQMSDQPGGRFTFTATDGGYTLTDGNGVYAMTAEQESTSIAMGTTNDSTIVTTTEDAPVASFTITASATSGNYLINDVSTGLHLNAYFGQGGDMTLWNGTGDASQWKIVDASTSTAIAPESIEEGKSYYLVSQMTAKLGQYLYYDPANSKLWLSATTTDNSAFAFEKDASGNYLIRSVANNVYIYQGAKSSELTMGKKQIINETKVANAANASIFNLVYADADKYSIYLQKDSSYVGNIDGTVCLTDSLHAIAFYPSVYKSLFEKSLATYYMPCGDKLSTLWLYTIGISGENVLKPLTYSATAEPSTYYTLYTDQTATVSRGQNITVTVKCRSALVTGGTKTLALHFDWDGDGTFETSQIYAYPKASTDLTYTVNVPETAKLGRTRMRVIYGKVTSNGSTGVGAEDKVAGTIYDLVVNVAEPQDYRTATVTVCDESRGTATLSEEKATYAYGEALTATATPKGNATFTGWREGKTIVSTDANYTFTVDHNVGLEAIFTPNTQADEDAINSPKTTGKASQVSVSADHGVITISSPSTVRQAYVYNAAGQIVARGSSSTLVLRGTTNQCCVVKVVNAEGISSHKLMIK